MNKEVIEKALKQFKREDRLDSPYNKEYGLDIDSSIEVFLTTREMVNYYKQQQELERYKNTIERIQNIYTSMQFSAPENMYVFIDQLGGILEELKGSDE